MHILKRVMTPEEKGILDAKIIKIQASLATGINWLAILIFIGMGIVFAFHIYYFNHSNWSWVSKFLVSPAFIGAWVVIEEFFRKKKIGQQHLQRLVQLKHQGQLSILRLDVHRIAKMEEYGDEGIIYLIELYDKRCLYLLDVVDEWSQDENFPSDQLEIYTDDDAWLGMGKRLICSGNKLTPIVVEAESKFAYFEEVGFPEDLEIENKSFDDVLEEIKTSVS